MKNGAKEVGIKYVNNEVPALLRSSRDIYK